MQDVARGGTMVDVVLEERAFSEVKRLCCMGFDGPALLGEVIERLRRVVPVEAYCASTKDPASGFITHGMAEELGGADDIFWSLERLYFEHHQSVRRMMDIHQSVALLSETTGGDLERSTRYLEYLRPLGLAHEMRGAFTSGGYLWGSMDLIRESGSPDFETREANLLRRIAPHLGNGLKMAALRMQAPVEEGGTDVPGVLTLDYQGSVVQHTPAAERWLRDLEDLGPGWREWDGLPRALHTVFLLLRRTLSPERDRDEESVPSLRARARSGRWLTLYGSLTEATPERRAETVIIIEPTKPEELLPFSMSAYGLSPREEEIVKFVVRGLSTTRISRTLFISEYTVQNHLRSVFEKVGVRSRGELVKRLFFDNLYPTLFR
jgi:DNA-binding CsgD family transcriptional regulator